MKPEELFQGILQVHGMVLSRQGRAVRHFIAQIDTNWTDRGILREHFIFTDGEHQHRSWYLYPIAPGIYRGVADDVVGSADIRTRGHALQLKYRFRITVNGRNIVVNMDDWMYRLDAETVLNRTGLYKFGIRIGEIISVIRRTNGMD